jgi:hypothetical protein
MDKSKAVEFVELALAALRDLEEAVHDNHRETINLKTEVLRQALFNVLEELQKDG